MLIYIPVYKHYINTLCWNKNLATFGSSKIISVNSIYVHTSIHTILTYYCRLASNIQ